MDWIMNIKLAQIIQKCKQVIEGSVSALTCDLSEGCHAGVRGISKAMAG
ncbi:MAG: hypothetical protein ABUT20_61605 [Bacteroidota bacterium]